MLRWVAALRVREGAEGGAQPVGDGAAGPQRGERNDRGDGEMR